MDATYSPRVRAQRPARSGRPGRPRRIVLALAAALAVALLASGCETGQQVPWATYDSQLQPRIDAATATGNCAALQAFLTTAKTTSRAHEKASGFTNDALVSYIQAAQERAGCPASTG